VYPAASGLLPPGQPLVTHYVDNTIISMLLTTIKKEDKFEYLWNKVKSLGGVLQMDHQLLINKEVYSVLTYIVRPKSRIEMSKRRSRIRSSKLMNRTSKHKSIFMCNLGPTTRSVLSSWWRFFALQKLRSTFLSRLKGKTGRTVS